MKLRGLRKADRAILPALRLGAGRAWTAARRVGLAPDDGSSAAAARSRGVFGRGAAESADRRAGIGARTRGSAVRHEHRRQLDGGLLAVCVLAAGRGGNRLVLRPVRRAFDAVRGVSSVYAAGNFPLKTERPHAAGQAFRPRDGASSRPASAP